MSSFYPSYVKQLSTLAKRFTSLTRPLRWLPIVALCCFLLACASHSSVYQDPSASGKLPLQRAKIGIFPIKSRVSEYLGKRRAHVDPQWTDQLNKKLASEISLALSSSGVPNHHFLQNLNPNLRTYRALGYRIINTFVKNQDDSSWQQRFIHAGFSLGPGLADSGYDYYLMFRAKQLIHKKKRSTKYSSLYDYPDNLLNFSRLYLSVALIEAKSGKLLRFNHNYLPNPDSRDNDVIKLLVSQSLSKIVNEN